MEPSVSGVALPRYRCQKEVGALRIKSIERIKPVDGEDADAAGAVIMPEESGFPPIRVSAEFLRKHRPQVGGFFIIYANDGYRSFIPGRDFTVASGWERITPHV